MGEILEGGKEEKGKTGRERERGKEADKEKSENGEEKKGNCKRGGEKLFKMEGKRYENEQRTFFFFFCLSLSETTEICNLFGVYQIGNFYKQKSGNGKFSNLTHF